MVPHRALAIDAPSTVRFLRRVGLPFALGLLVMVAIVSYRRVREFEHDVLWRGHTHEVLEHIERTQTALLGADSMRRAYRLSRDPADRVRMEAQVAASERELAEVELLTRDNASQQTRIGPLRAVLAERVAILHDGLELPNWEALEPAARDAQRARQTEGSNLAKQTSAQIDAMRSEEQRLLEERERRMVTSAENTERTIFYGTAVGVLLVVLIYASHVRESRARLRVQRELAYTNTLFTAVLRESTDVIAVKDTEGRYLLLNPAGCRSLGRSEEDILGKTDRQVLSDGTGDSVMEGDQAVLRAGTALTYEQVASVGDRIWTFHSTKAPFRNAEGEIIGLVAVSRDITEKKKLEERLQETLRTQATRDPLTGLYNRRYLDETLTRELLRVERRGAPLALIMADVDHFKRVNDTAGHVAGDEVLKQVAQVLLGAVRREDVVCRYGGEEFMIVLPELAASAAIERAERMRCQLEQLPNELGGHKTGRITASFGVASFPVQGPSAEALIVAADGALYGAKRGGRNRVVDAADAIARRA
jgi:diguanylate cyclase (GGDEF)-like protein/PAS domain S-box-containing protein